MRKINQPPSGTPSKATSEQPAVVAAPAETPAPEAVVEVVSDEQASDKQVSDAVVEEAPKKRSRKKSDTSSDADGATEEAQPTEELA